MADADISSFIEITGASTPVARSILEMTNGDVSQAVQLFFENPDLEQSINSASAAPPARSSGTQRGVREDDDGVIHIDSDDDDDVQMSGRDAHLETDEEMARRLQEDSYAGAPGGVEDVRSPIQRTTETLIAPGPGGGVDFDTGPMGYFPPPRPTRRGKRPSLAL